MFFKQSGMTTLTINVNEQTKKGKAFIAMTKDLVKDSKSIIIIKSEPEATLKDESKYNPKFVSKILDRYNNIDDKKLVVINPNDVWENIL